MKSKSLRVREEEQLECFPVVKIASETVGETRSRSVSPIYLDENVARQRPPIVPRRRGKLIAFGWYGGKFSHLSWLLPLLPECHHYCEPFAGSAAVLLNREPSPVESYNDIDGEVVNFFRVLRDDARRLTRQLGLTPFSREEFYEAVFPQPDDSPLERAEVLHSRTAGANGARADRHARAVG